MTKQELIGIVTGIGKRIEPAKRGELFVSEKKNEKKEQDENENNKDNRKIGCNQFRDIAILCKGAECYEEIEMLIRYNMSKCKGGESWMFDCGGGTLFGSIVLECMDDIYNTDKKKCMEDLELFFGYLYWQSRIWAAESQKG